MDENRNKNLALINDFIPLSEAAKISGYSLTHLNLLARTGKLRAKKIGRNWHTTSEWIGELIDRQHEKKEEEKDRRILMKDGSKDYVDVNLAASRIMARHENDNHERDEIETIKENEAARLNVDRIKEEILNEIGARKYGWKYAISLIVILMIFGASILGINQKVDKDKISEIEKYFADSGLESRIVNENEKSGRVMGEEDVAEEKIGSLQESENYVIDEVSFGAGVVLAGFDESKKLEITDVHSESFLDTKRNEVKMLVAWKTNKPAKTELSYSKNSGMEARRIQEESYGYTHAAVITELEPKTSYVYKVRGNDKWGNNVESDYFGTFTTSKPISVFELITRALDDLFGWAFKKQK